MSTEEQHLARPGNQAPVRDARLKRLAESIDALAEKDEISMRHRAKMRENPARRPPPKFMASARAS